MRNSIRTIALAGLAVGGLDGLAAVTAAAIRGVPPERVFQYISSGILGRCAFEGGAATVMLGILLHFIVALGAATVFVFAAGSIALLRRDPLIIGALYGLAVYLFMSGLSPRYPMFPASRGIYPERSRESSSTYSSLDFRSH